MTRWNLVRRFGAFLELISGQAPSSPFLPAMAGSGDNKANPFSRKEPNDEKARASCPSTPNLQPIRECGRSCCGGFEQFQAVSGCGLCVPCALCVTCSSPCCPVRDRCVLSQRDPDPRNFHHFVSSDWSRRESFQVLCRTRFSQPIDHQPPTAHFPSRRASF